MKKPQNTITPRYIFLFLVVAAIQLKAQDAGFIDGKIVDAETGEPLFFANVFLANTTIGATTARDGYYRIKEIPPGAYELVAHHIGYELMTRKVLITGADSLRCDFEINLKVLQLDEITVFAPKSKGLLWKLNLDRFNREFIGESKYSRECKILNHEVLDFQIDPDTKVFVASSDQVLEIENRALGYMIHVILKEYRSQKPRSSVGFSLQWVVLPRFELLEPESRRELEKWERNRRLCYEGSLRYFLAMLAGNEDGSDSFWIYSGSRTALENDLGMVLSVDELKVTPDDRTPFYRWESDTWLKVSYRGDDHNSNFIWLPEGYTLFDTFGNCVIPYSIELVGGYWTQKRMADTLPFDYRPGINLE